MQLFKDIGYTLPKSILTKSKILNNVRIHASVNNVFVITPYNGLDPPPVRAAANINNLHIFFIRAFFMIRMKRLHQN